MAEYIEREALLRRFNIDDMMNVNGTLIVLDDARATIKGFPAADVESVKRGEWEFDGIHTSCSVCGSGRPTKALDHKIAGREARFCYYCGAKMKG